jgi:hypothetical protein
MSTSKSLLAALSLSLLVSCGGGGGNDSTVAQQPAAAGTSFTGIATAGELITYNVDLNGLTYSYTIIESQFGLTGKTGAGKLTKLADGTYLTDSAVHARIAVLPNGILLAALHETFNGVLKTVPVIGFSNPVTTFSAAASTYNFVQRSCIAASCSQRDGTFIVRADGTWASCPSGDLSAGPCASTGNTGTLNNLGNGRFQVIDSRGGVNVGTAIAFASNGQNVVLVDLKDTRNPGLGLGILVGSQQRAVGPAEADGTWISGDINGNFALFTVSGTNVKFADINALPSTATTTVSFNAPWTGMAVTGTGLTGLLAGSGVYVAGSGTDFAELGIRITAGPSTTPTTATPTVAQTTVPAPTTTATTSTAPTSTTPMTPPSTTPTGATTPVSSTPTATTPTATTTPVSSTPAATTPTATPTATTIPATSTAASATTPTATTIPATTTPASTTTGTTSTTTPTATTATTGIPVSTQ